MAYSSEPRIVHHREPVFAPLRASQELLEAEKAVVADSSRLAAERDLALLRALNQPATTIKPELVLKQPGVPANFEQQVAELDEAIFERGIAIDRERLLSLGKRRFAQLLSTDHQARVLQREIGIAVDLTEWGSVFLALCRTDALSQVPVPARTTFEQWHGIDQQREQIREVEGFIDLFKVFRAQPQVVRAIRAFRQSFETSVFGQSMLEQLSDDDRLRSKFFCGGSGNKVRLFCDWLAAVEPLHQINLATHLNAVVFWLASETTALADLVELAREYFNTRCPSQAQIEFTSAVFDGFMLGHSTWPLWQFVGRATGTQPDDALLNRQLEELKQRFRMVQVFHRDLERCFLKAEGDHYRVDEVARRRFIDQKFAQLRDCVSMLAALTVEETQPGAIAVRFRDRLFLTQQAQSVIDAKISEKLNAVFT